MSDNKKNIFSKISDKLKRIKHLDIILTSLFIAIVLLIYLSTLSQPKDNNQNTTDNVSQPSTNEIDDYASSLASSLENLISSIEGVSSCKVAIYFVDDIKTEIAYVTESKTLTDGTKVESKSPVLITTNGEQHPIILQKIMPKPVSVTIVAKGAADTKVKLNILRLVESMLDISAQKIEIFQGN